MTYIKLERLTANKNFPLAGVNSDGENVIIEKGVDKWTYQNEGLEREFFKLTTAQHNGFTRINFYYDDGQVDEFYTK